MLCPSALRVILHALLCHAVIRRKAEFCAQDYPLRRRKPAEPVAKVAILRLNGAYRPILYVFYLCEHLLYFAAVCARVHSHRAANGARYARRPFKTHQAMLDRILCRRAYQRARARLQLVFAVLNAGKVSGNAYYKAFYAAVAYQKVGAVAYYHIRYVKLFRLFYAIFKLFSV